MSERVNAGIVTAYGAAVRGGYEGTYTQFCADLASLADIITDLTGLSATATTLAEGASATASYANGVITIGIPRGATGNGISSVSLVSTSGLAKTYRITFTDGDTYDFTVNDGKGISSTTLNQDYTLTITYNDGTTWTSTSIRGAKGDTGETPDLSIGTVTTGAAGSSASATITGTAEAPVLNLTIPKGDPGEVPADAIASTQASTTASKKLEVGEYFWLSGSLYIVTTEIASGGTIVTSGSGANCKLAKVADDVGDLKSALQSTAGSPLYVSLNEFNTYKLNQTTGNAYIDFLNNRLVARYRGRSDAWSYVDLLNGSVLSSVTDYAGTEKTIKWNKYLKLSVLFNQIGGSTGQTIPVYQQKIISGVATAKELGNETISGTLFKDYMLDECDSFRIFVVLKGSNSNTQVFDIALAVADIRENQSDKVVAPILSQYVTETEVKKDDFRVIGDTLYKAKADIPTNTNIVVGTNMDETTVGNELNLLQNSTKINNLFYSGIVTDDAYIGELGGIGYNKSQQMNKVSDFIPVQPGENIIIKYKATPVGNGNRIAITYQRYKADKSRDGTRVSYTASSESETEYETSITIPTNTRFLRVCPAFYDDGEIFVYKTSGGFIPDYAETDRCFNTVNNAFWTGTGLIDGIAHRGYSTFAPENTLIAYKMAKQHGFLYGETDISFTSDNVPVLLHDDTINRTARNSDGTTITGTVGLGSITYEQALEYDFGIWKGSAFAGTRIPTFEEYLALCKKIGMRPYIEIKAATATETRVRALVDMVKGYDLIGVSTWVCFDTTYLGYVKSEYPDATLVVPISSGITSAFIENVLTLKNDKNKVIVSSATYTSEEVAMCKNAGLPMHLWAIDKLNDVLAMPSYASGLVHETLNAPAIFAKYNIT